METKTKILLIGGAAIVAHFLMSKKKAAANQLGPSLSDVGLNLNWNTLNTGYADQSPEENAAADGKNISVLSGFSITLNPATTAAYVQINNQNFFRVDLDMNVTNLTNQPQQLGPITLNSTKHFGGGGLSKGLDAPTLAPGQSANVKQFFLFNPATFTSVSVDPMDFLANMSIKIK